MDIAEAFRKGELTMNKILFMSLLISTCALASDRDGFGSSDEEYFKPKPKRAEPYLYFDEFDVEEAYRTLYAKNEVFKRRWSLSLNRPLTLIEKITCQINEDQKPKILQRSLSWS